MIKFEATRTHFLKPRPNVELFDEMEPNIDSINDVIKLDRKTVGFFLKISKEIGKAWGKGLTRAKRASLARP